MLRRSSMGFRRHARRGSVSDVVIIKTSSGGKMVVGVVAGAFFVLVGSVFLFGATSIASTYDALLFIIGGLMSFLVGALVAIGAVVEALSPVRVHVEDDDVVISRKRVFGPPRLTFIPYQDVAGVVVEVERHDESESYRVAFALSGEKRVPLTDYHHLDDLAEGRRIAGRLERMLAGARPE